MITLFKNTSQSAFPQNIKQKQYKNSNPLLILKKQEPDKVSFKARRPPSSRTVNTLLAWLRSRMLLNAMRIDPHGTISSILEIERVLADLTKAVDNVPRGFFERTGNQLTVTSFDTDKGLSPSPKVTQVVIPEHVKLFSPGTSADTILTQALPERPFVTIGPVGWSSVKPDCIDPDKCDLRYWGKDPKSQKEVLQQAYQNAFNGFMGPVFEYLKQTGLDPKKIALVSSFSDCGIDKAIMDFAKNNNSNLLTVGPYKFAEYMPSEINFPVVLENTVQDYGTKFAKLADMTLVTGGRKHAWEVDTENQLMRNGEPTVPVDLFRMFHGIEIPATGQDGSIENSARLLTDLGASPFNDKTKRIFDTMPEEGKDLLKFDEQRAVAAQIYSIYKAREKAAALANQ